MKLASYVSGAWVEGQGKGSPLVDPVTGDQLAEATSEGVDVAAALAYAREKGGPALRAMSFAERAELIGRVADVLSANRETYYDIALRNSGNTKVDAGIDIDGGIGTLKFFAKIGQSLGDARLLKDGGMERLSRDEAFRAMHLLVPIEGVGIHINAFNFPSWGLWEKAGVSLLSGVPVLAKPATATALLSYQMVRDVVEAGILPEGALTFVCGSAREISDLVTAQDAIAFTGSADTAAILKAHPRIIASGVRLNIEADSLNCAILGPDAKADSPELALFVREIVKEMTIKAGQKCTAIRRALVPAPLLETVAAALKASLESTVVGNPRNETVRMGPLVSRTQQASVQEAIARLRQETRVVTGDGTLAPVDADPAAGCFVAPTLLVSDDPLQASAPHEVEAFGPVCTLMPYHGSEQAIQLAGKGGGSLAASLFTADPEVARTIVTGIGAWHGRVLVVDDSIAKGHTGHGIVMPMCVHGGPGRAGGGEELGGLRSLRFYHQRLAVQGRGDWLEAIPAAPLPA